jgi:hypothetical protein
VAEEQRSVRAESMIGKPLSIEYATPSVKETFGGEVDKLLHVGRRLVFAVGVGLLMYGVGDGFGSRRGNAPAFMGWGAALAALVMPWGWRRRTED